MWLNLSKLDLTVDVDDDGTAGNDIALKVAFGVAGSLSVLVLVSTSSGSFCTSARVSARSAFIAAIWVCNSWISPIARLRRFCHTRSLVWICAAGGTIGLQSIAAILRLANAAALSGGVLLGAWTTG